MVPETVSHFIGGRHVRSTLRKTYGAADPADGQLRDAQTARPEPAAEPGHLPSWLTAGRSV